MTYRIIIKRMYPYDGEGNVKAFFDVKLTIGKRVFGYNDLRVVRNKETGELFIAHPSKPGMEQGEYFDYSYTDAQTKKDIQKEAIASYNRKLKLMEAEVQAGS